VGSVGLFLGLIIKPELYHYAFYCQMNDVHNYGGSWKRLYLERHMQEHIENLTPEDFVQSEVESLVDLCSPYVKRLKI
jgi:predicted SprT family Zn-dependent metalloprotease